MAEVFVAQGAWASHLVLAELSRVLSAAYGLDARAVATAIEMLLDHREIVLQDPEVVSAALEHFKRRPRLGFSDCLVLETARKAGNLPLGTFDKGLSKLDGAERL